MPQDFVPIEGEQALACTSYETVKPPAAYDVLSSFASIGVLGSEDRYTIPRSVLRAAARHLGGELVQEMAPFLVPCTDGLALIVTITKEHDFMGGAFFLPASQLDRFDRGLTDLWRRADKTQTAHDFFDETAFALRTDHRLPDAVEDPWRLAFC